MLRLNFSKHNNWNNWKSQRHQYLRRSRNKPRWNQATSKSHHSRLSQTILKSNSSTWRSNTSRLETAISPVSEEEARWPNLQQWTTPSTTMMITICHLLLPTLPSTPTRSPWCLPPTTCWAQSQATQWDSAWERDQLHLSNQIPDHHQEKTRWEPPQCLSEIKNLIDPSTSISNNSLGHRPAEKRMTASNNWKVNSKAKSTNKEEATSTTGIDHSLTKIWKWKSNSDAKQQCSQAQWKLTTSKINSQTN